MEYVKLGNSDLNVSRICLGCMGFGEAAAGQHRWTLDEENSNEIIKAALENGINFFDTAMSYQGGTSEMFVGRALCNFARREDVVLATKFEPRTDEEIANGVTGQQHVKNCLDASLKRLGMDYVDLYICHMWDYRTPIEEIMEGLNDAVKAGKVRASASRTAMRGSWHRRITTPVCTAWRSLCPFRGIIISFSARRSAKWRRSARQRTLR